MITQFYIYRWKFPQYLKTVLKTPHDTTANITLGYFVDFEMDREILEFEKLTRGVPAALFPRPSSHSHWWR
jgi:hypothetical protein